MNLTKYKATGICITLMTKILDMEVRATGTERLPVDRPIMFVVNHFTRSETFLLPWVILHRFDRPVRSLATPAIFHGRLGRYLDSIGVLSTRDPRRNRIILGDLLTGRNDWVVYPEGGLVKNKKTVDGGRLRLDRPGRRGRPHTGAAMLALQAELRRQRYIEGCRTQDADRCAYYEKTYGLHKERDVSRRGVLLVPVNITYAHPRGRDNLILRTARRFGQLSPYLEEELTVEGAILMGRPEISVDFGVPIEVDEFLRHAQRTRLPWKRSKRSSASHDPRLQREALRLTQYAMRRVYAKTEINIEHLLCYGIRAARRDRLPADELRRALFLAVMELRGRDDLRLHPSLRNGIVRILEDGDFEPLDRAARLVAREGVLERQNGSFVIDRPRLTAPVDFHEIRLRQMNRVVANELEPIESATNAIRDAVNLKAPDLRRRLPAVIHASDRAVFRRDYRQWRRPLVTHAYDVGDPFYLERRGATHGIVLVHGYLSAPAQMRLLAEFLHDRGMAVYGVRLPGHGTSPENLNTATWRDWMESVKQADTALRHACDKVLVGGFSMGGIVALLHAASCGQDIAGVFAVNAPMKLRKWWTMFTPLLVHGHRLTPSARHLLEAPIVRNRSESPDTNYAATTVRSVAELHRLMVQCERRLPAAVAPALIIESDDDPVIAPRSAERIAHRIGSTDVTIERLVSRRHVLVRGPDSPRTFDLIGRFTDRLGATPRVTAPRNGVAKFVNRCI